MKKLLFLFAFLYSCASAQIKICQLPSTNTGSVNDWMIKQDSSCVNGTKKIKVTDFISHYLGASGGLPAAPLNSLQYNNAGAFGGAKVGYSESFTEPHLTVDTLKELTIGDDTQTQLFHVGVDYVDMGSSGGSSVLCQGNDLTLFGNGVFLSQNPSGLYKYLSGASYGVLDFSAASSLRNYAFHDYSGHLELSEGIPISYSDLTTGIAAQALSDAKYKLTDGNNPGLVVPVIEGSVSPKGNIIDSTLSRGSIQFQVQGFATSGTFNVLKGATVLNSVPIAWVSTDTPNDYAVAAASAVDLAGYTAFAIADYVYINNNSTGTGIITTPTVTGDAIGDVLNDFAGGSTYSLRATYNVSTDEITCYYDGNGNAIATPVIDFLFNDGNYTRNDFLQDNGSDFTNHTLSGCGDNVHRSGKVLVNGSNADYFRNEISTNSTVDLVNLTSFESFADNVIAIGRNPFTPNKACDLLTVTTANSDYENTLTVTSNTIDFNQNAGTNWTGIVQAQGQVNTVNGLDVAPHYFNIHPPTGQTLIFDATDVTNIKLGYGVSTITAIGDSGDVVYFYNDGDTAYVLNSKADICHSKIKADSIVACSPLVLSGTSVVFPTNTSAAILATDGSGVLSTQTKSGLLGYKSYIASVTQSGTSAPSATVAGTPDIGATITWARTSAGLYTATASSAVFTASKTAVFISSPTTGLIAYSYVNTSTSVITFTTSLNSVIATVLSAIATDALFTNAIIEIRVLN